MLSAPSRPSRWTGPPGQRSPRSSVPTSIASELLRGLGSPLGSRPDLDLDRVERLDVVSPDQGDEEASVEIGRSRPHRHTPSRHRRSLAFGNGSHPVALVRADATFRAGVVESDRGTQGSPPERRAGLIQKFGGSVT